MSKNDTIHLGQEFLRGMSSGAEPSEIANLFSEDMKWEIAGDTNVLPWIGQKSGRAAVTAFINDSTDSAAIREGSVVESVLVVDSKGSPLVDFAGRNSTNGENPCSTMEHNTTRHDIVSRLRLPGMFPKTASRTSNSELSPRGPNQAINLRSRQLMCAGTRAGMNATGRSSRTSKVNVRVSGQAR